MTTINLQSNAKLCDLDDKNDFIRNLLFPSSDKNIIPNTAVLPKVEPIINILQQNESISTKYYNQIFVFCKPYHVYDNIDKFFINIKEYFIPTKLIYANHFKYINITCINDEKMIEQFVNKAMQLGFYKPKKQKIYEKTNITYKIEKSELYEESLNLLKNKFPDLSEEKLIEKYCTKFIDTKVIKDYDGQTDQEFDSCLFAIYEERITEEIYFTDKFECKLTVIKRDFDKLIPKIKELFE
jgi:hypothetical protein